MMPVIDETHDPALRSWVDSADRHSEFPIQNLPLGVFSPHGEAARGGVAIGDHILDLAAAADAGLFAGNAERAARAAAGPTLNPLLALGPAPRRALRRRVSALLADTNPDRARLSRLLYPAQDCTMHLPCAVGDYTDFYAGIHHAMNVGRQLRPDNPLLPNYKHVPIGYHGRASSVRPSGAPVRRPRGQIKPSSGDSPVFAPTERLDYEVELGVWIGQGNPLGQPIPLAAAADHIAGLCLLNDWSARDVQTWEYQPLGPFLAKSFLTTVSPWIVTAEALAPFRVAQPARPDGDPSSLDYLHDEGDQATGAFAIVLEAFLTTAAMRRAGLSPHRLSHAPATALYWTVAQLVAHHTSCGCNLNPGDLFGTGTISAPTPDGYGSLLELSAGGRTPIALAGGETRTFLEDGDEVTFAAHARTQGRVAIGFGACSGRVMASV